MGVDIVNAVKILRNCMHV